MKKIFVCIMVILLISLSITGCNDSGGKDPKQSRENILNEFIPPYNHIELIMYTGLRNITDHKRQEMIDNIVEELNELSRSTLGITIRLAYSDSPLYEPLLWDHDIPDINVINGFFDIGFNAGVAGISAYRSYFPNNKLSSYYRMGYIDDISQYINYNTPYISLLWNQYPAFQEASRIDDKTLGILIPDYRTDTFPVLMIKKSIADQYIHYEITDYEVAFDLCMKISSEKKDESNKVYIAPDGILSWIVGKGGYSSFISELYYFYLLKSDDSDQQIFRIDETELWDQLITTKKEMIYNNILVNEQQFYIDMSDHLVDAALFNGLKVLENLYDLEPSLIDDYVIMPLYENYKTNPGYYFTVSEQCEEKQRAFQYIDWLLSNDDARKLIGYGIEGVNYKYGEDESVIYFFDEVNRLSLVPVGTGGNFMTKGYSILGDLGRATYIKDKIFKNYESDSTRIKDINEYAKALDDLYKNYKEYLSDEYILCRFPVFNMNKMRSDQIMRCFFDDYVTIYFLNEFYGRIKDAYNPFFMKDLQEAIKYR